MPTTFNARASRSGPAPTAPIAGGVTRLLRTVFALGFAVLAGVGVAEAGQTHLLGPAGSFEFGKRALLLPNGNIVVADYGGPFFSRVYLMRPDGSLISTLAGTADDRLGSGGLVLLANGNYVIISPEHDASGVSNSGAVTWGDANTGTPTSVNATTSMLSGLQTRVDIRVDPLDNGDYAVRWGGGIWTWGDGQNPIVGTVSPQNSLYVQYLSSSPSGYVRPGPVVDLGGGRYLVVTPDASNGSLWYAGAITRAGRGGPVGEMSSAVSMMGTKAYDRIGLGGVTLLGNGQAIVSSPEWGVIGASNSGAVTWIDTRQALSGTVDATNSLVGNSPDDRIGTATTIGAGVTSIGGGRYVIVSPDWQNAAGVAVGAVTWVDSALTRTGTVTAANSLIGSTAGDLRDARVTALRSRHFVITARYWDGGRTMADVGAVVWANGGTGITGTIGIGNALIGNGASDRLGDEYLGVIALNDGNYVVPSPSADVGAVENAGAATWGSGTAGVVGRITAANSLVGSSSGDSVGANVVALPDAGYAVAAPGWSNGAISRVGAVVSTSGPRLVGTISASTALTGTQTNDQVGSDAHGMTLLADGSVLVRSRVWGGNRGAMTRWQPQVPPVGAVVGPHNSMILASEAPLLAPPLVLPDEGHAYVDIYWRGPQGSIRGAATLARNDTVGESSESNSVLGLVVQAGPATLSIIGYDPLRRHLVVAQPAANVITLLDERSFADGFE
jgi:hypothetical protein